MNKIKNLISMLFIFVALIGTIVCKVRMEQIDIERNGIIHSFQEDNQRDQAYKEYELWFSVFAASFIIALAYLIGKYMIEHVLNARLENAHPRRIEIPDKDKQAVKIEQSEQTETSVQIIQVEPTESTYLDEQTEKFVQIVQGEQNAQTADIEEAEPTELSRINEHTEQVELINKFDQPSLNKTLLGRRKKQKVTISDDFKSLFRPAFINHDDNITKRKVFNILKDILEESEWSITDIGRILNLCYNSSAHNPKYTNFSNWMIDVCKALNRPDCPSAPNKSAYSYDISQYPLSELTSICRYKEKLD